MAHEQQFDFGYNQLFFNNDFASIQTVPSQAQLRYPLDAESATSVLDALRNIEIDRTPDGMVVDDTPTTTAQTRAQNDYILGVFRGNDQDGLTETTTGITITRLLVNTRMTAASAGGADVFFLESSGGLGTKDKGSANLFDWDNNYEFFCRCESSPGQADISSQIGTAFFWGLSGLAATGTLPNSLGTGINVPGRHFGFFVARNNTLVASSADGTTQETTIIPDVTFTIENNYRIVFTAGVKVEFYVNDDLRTTHTTNIPSGATNPPEIRFGGRGGLDAENSPIIDFLLDNNYKVILS